MTKRVVQIGLTLLLLALVGGVVAAAPPQQEEPQDGSDYTVQPGDFLIELARRFYGDDDAFRQIVAATNARAAADSSYREIGDANIILVGQKLWIPGVAAILAEEAMMDEAAAADSASEAAAGTEVTDMADTSGPAAADLTLAGTSWILSTLNGATTIDSVIVTLDFAAENASGNGGCNGYSASYEVDGIHLTFGPTLGTLIACEQSILDQENAYFQALADTRYFEQTADTLRLFNEDLTMIASFAPANTRLAGSSWTALNYNNGNQAVVSVLADTELTAVFSEDGVVSGSAGCNNFTGSYSTAGNEIEIGPLASTRRACPEEIMDQESQYLAALESAATYQISGNRLAMRTADDAMAANFVRAD